MSDSDARVTGTVRRHFVEYDHPQGAYTSRAHVVTDRTEGEVMTPSSGTRAVRKGDVLVETGRPDVYDVYPADAWDDMGLQAQEDQIEYDTDEETAEEPVVQFNPSEHNATEVRQYLRSLDTDTDDGEAEYERVETAEREGNNRQSAFPRR